MTTKLREAETRRHARPVWTDRGVQNLRPAKLPSRAFVVIVRHTGTHVSTIQERANDGLELEVMARNRMSRARVIVGGGKRPMYRHHASNYSPDGDDDPC